MDRILSSNYIKGLKDIIIYDKSKYNQINIDSFIHMNLPKLEIEESLLREKEKPQEIEVREPNLSEKLFSKHKKKYNFYVNEVNSKNDYEYYKYVQEEEDRKHKLNIIKKEHEININNIVNQRRLDYINRDKNIISLFNEELLRRSKYPFKFKRDISISYDKLNKVLNIDYKLPTKEIISIEKNKEEIYNEIVQAIMYISIMEVFKADENDAIDKVNYCGHINNISIISHGFNKNNLDKMKLTLVEELKFLNCI